MTDKELLFKAVNDIYDMVQKNSRSSDLLAVGAVGLKLLAEILKHLDNGVKFDANAPCNVYGEGLVDGIQNAIERGQRGISTHG